MDDLPYDNNFLGLESLPFDNSHEAPASKHSEEIHEDPKPPTRVQRSLGCLLGLACGDAVGTALEFRKPGTFDPIADMVGGGPFKLIAGQWTDDTAMSLCLAQSLLMTRGFDLRDQCARYYAWYDLGRLSSNGRCFDIGNTTRAALNSFNENGNPYNGSTNSRAAGNGSLMRMAPVPILLQHHPEAAVELSGEHSLSTHGAPAAVDACRYFAALLVGAIGGAPKEDLCRPYYTPKGMREGYWQQSEHALVPEIDMIAAGSFKDKSPPDIVGSGYVVQSLEAVLWAFWHSETFEHGCLLATNLGNDADTTAAIYGALLHATATILAVRTHYLTILALLTSGLSIASSSSCPLMPPFPPPPPPSLSRPARGCILRRSFANTGP
jgi:ADP-ribosylglycohydrolase